MIGLKWTEADIDASWLRLEDSGCDGLAASCGLLLILGPGLLTAIAFEHTDGAAGLGIQHRPKQRWLLIAIVTRLDRIGGVPGKDFVLELVIHGWPACRSVLH